MTRLEVGTPFKVFGDRLFEQAKASNPLGFLVCQRCGWAWLTVETAGIDWEWEVVCRSKFDCFRRDQMKMVAR